MATATTTRLTFLYPHLFRTGGPVASSATRSSRRKPLPATTSPFLCCQHAAPFTAPSAGRQASFAKRAGKAIEPPLAEPPKPPPKTDQSEGGKQEGAQLRAEATPPPPPPPPPQPVAPPPVPDLPPTIELPAPGVLDANTQTRGGGPMDEILHMGPPPDSMSEPPSPPDALTPDSQPSSPTATSTAPDTEPSKPPKSPPTPYIHHFDSYTLVKQLTAGGYTLPQAILSMKAIRRILASHLDGAQAGLVSKADVENETYLFRAACSELSAEVRNNRRAADEQLRQQRTLLQHEVDILAQRLNQELLTLTDSVRGMFNDRRMVVREEQKALESRVR
ncbi:hypothetical protein C8A05DRAFT_19875, partial [Staphylotrichum tortipilum]